MKPHHGVARIGRMARWQRRSTYLVLLMCALSGLGWFIGLDLLDMPPPHLTAWWLMHGVSGFVALVVIGAVLPAHVVATWRSRRNVLAGTAALALMGAVAATALLLLYGPEATRALAHGVHCLLGLTAGLAFVWHIVRGRRSVALRAAARR